MAVIHLSSIREESDCNSVLDNSERVGDLECLVVVIDPIAPVAPPKPQLVSVLQSARNMRDFRLAGAEEGPTGPVFSGHKKGDEARRGETCRAVSSSVGQCLLGTCG